MVVGRQDHAISIKSIEVVSQSYGGCPYVVIENAGHWVQQENPSEVLRIIIKFVFKLF